MLDPGAMGTLLIGGETARYRRGDSRPSHDRPQATKRGRLGIRRQVAATLYHVARLAPITVPKATRRELRP